MFILEFKEIIITVPTEMTECAENICTTAVSWGFYTEDYSDLEQGAWEIAHIDIIDEQLLKQDRTRSKIHIYIPDEENPAEILELLKELLAASKVDYNIESSSVSDEDWKDNWKKYFKPTEIGSRLAIKPSWEEYTNPNRAVLEIDPGAAFGTGTHATTLMCLEFLDRAVKGGESVLDIGCGSGILAASAVLLGADKADGVDIDPVAVRVARENAELNNIGGKTNFICGDLAEKITEKYDIVCANIVADVIIRLSENVTDYMKSGAFLVCSGIINERAGEVLEALRNAGLKAEEILTKDGWTAVVCAR